MSKIICDDGTNLFVEEAGSGMPILFVHEFGGDSRSWKYQVDAFSKSYRCIVYTARGFCPSDIPDSEDRYGQERSTRDLLNLIAALSLERFHLVGLSMGSFTSLMAALNSNERLLSLTLASCSSGPCTDEQRQRYRMNLEKEAALLQTKGGDGAVTWFATDPAYQRMAHKRPGDWRAYRENLRGQSVEGALRTLRTVHWNRLCIWTLESRLRKLPTPTLLVIGDEDHPLIEPTNLYLSKTLPNAKLLRLQKTGHLVNIEEPEAFNNALAAQLRASEPI